jgi:methionyl-tRNA formyltransferase
MGLLLALVGQIVTTTASVVFASAVEDADATSTGDAISDERADEPVAESWKSSPMTEPNSRLVFFGNERIATGVSTDCPTLRALIEAGYDIAAVVSSYEVAQSRQARALEIAEVAKAHNIPLLLPEKLGDIRQQLDDLGAQAGVLVAYGKMVPESIINLFPRGIINIHPSLLPLHRGSMPIESAILSGEQKTGVSLMKLVKAMDAGPVYTKIEHELTGLETKQELADLLLDAGSRVLIEILPGILDGSILPVEQDETNATYDSRIEKTSGLIDWHKPAERLEREIRAYAGWPKSSTSLRGIDLIITKAHAVPSNDESLQPGDFHADLLDTNILLIETADGQLCVDRLKPAGKNEMDVAGFLNGYGNKLKS